jgi:uncharacterized membrane protein YcaP (DUF421 family)
MLIIFSQFLNKEFLLGSEDWTFLWEIAIRTFTMFLVIILGIKILGKRGIKQLSIFELVVIIGLGSAAGDPMLYKEVGILSALIVFGVVILLYRLMTYIVEKFHKVELLLEGKPKIIIRNGAFCVEDSGEKDFGTEELFAALRQHNVSQLGQVKLAIEEITGEISVFYYEEKKVKYGLPILPYASKILKIIPSDGFYACANCAYTEKKNQGESGKCKKCSRKEWVQANKQKRIA